MAFIFFFTFSLIKIYSDKLSSKVVHVAEAKIKKFTESFLSNNIGYDLFLEDELEDILLINKNEEGEILYVDFNLKQAYFVLDKVTTVLNSLLQDLENGKIEVENDKDIVSNDTGLILSLPMFVSSDSVLLANLGPKVYFKVNFVGSVLTNIRSEIRDYGLNNALVELYVTIKISEELIAPVTKNTQEVEYDVLIASQVINGKVPAYYGGAIVEKSNLLSIPIE